MSIEEISLTMLYIFICRLMSHVPDVNTQSSIGELHFIMSFIAFNALVVPGYCMYFLYHSVFMS